SLSLALREARGRRHEFLTVEHVLYALLHDEAVAEVVRACGGDVDALKQELATYLDERLERLPPDSEASPERTLGFQRILQRDAARPRPPRRLHRQPGRARGRGPHRPAHRPRPGARADDPRPLPPPEEQPRLRG